MTYVSTLSLSSGPRQSVLQGQSALAQAQKELASGKKDDLGVSLGSQAGTDLTMKNQIDTLAGYTTSNALVSSRLDGSSTVLTSMLSAAQTFSQTLITASTSGGLTASLQNAGQNGLTSVLSQLNTADGSQFLFGGINSAVQPLTTYGAGSGAKQAVDDAFSQNFGISQTSDSASSISGSDMTSFLNGSFDNLFNDANWSANWSKASNQTINSTIAPSVTTSTSVSSNQTGFRQLVEAYTMISEFTGSNMSADAKAAVVTKATSLVQTAMSGINDAQVAVGMGQKSIDDANTNLSAQSNLLQGRVSDMEGADVYTLNNTIKTLQAQLQDTFSLTSQLQSLSLVNYLKG